MKLHDDRCIGEIVMYLKPFYLTLHLVTDRLTDRRRDQVIPEYPLASL